MNRYCSVCGEKLKDNETDDCEECKEFLIKLHNIIEDAMEKRR